MKGLRESLRQTRLSWRYSSTKTNIAIVITIILAGFITLVIALPEVDDTPGSDSETRLPFENELSATIEAEAESSESPLDNFGCELLYDVTLFTNQRDYDNHLIEITDVQLTTKNETTMKCEGYGQFKDGQILIVEMYARITDDDGIAYGYDTHYIED